jgi:peroxiredoxin
MNIPQAEMVATDFELADIDGRPVRLSEFRGHKNVVLVFLRGFL